MLVGKAIVGGLVMQGATFAAITLIAVAPAGWSNPRLSTPAVVTVDAAASEMSGPLRGREPPSGDGSTTKLAQRLDPDDRGGTRLTPDAPVAVDLGEPQPSSSYRVKDVGYNDVLNIRSGPNANSNVVGTIPPDGRGIRIYGRCSSSWCPIQYNGVQGWANGYYLAKE
jgi:uncharacterized protein YgiM (DUF1202 family)